MSTEQSTTQLTDSNESWEVRDFEHILISKVKNEYMPSKETMQRFAYPLYEKKKIFRRKMQFEI